MAKAPTRQELAAELIRKFPGTPNRTIARRLHKENPGLFNTLEAARSTVRCVVGASGEANRKMAATQRIDKPKGKAGWKPECPPSAADPWLPLQIDGPCKVLSLSDVHIPYHSREAVEAAVDFGLKLKPNILLLNGDTQDFYRGSRYQKDLNKRSLTEEIYTGRQFLSWLKSKFPKARRIYKMGNHDERWNHLIWNQAPELFDLDNVQLRYVMHFEDNGFEEVGDNPTMAGRLPVLHGHEFGSSLMAPVNPARGAFLRTNHTVLIGHLHRSSTHAESDMWHKQTVTWSQGCLCDLTPEYARINRWNHGFAFIDVAKDGSFNLHNYAIDGSEVRTA